MRRLVALLVAVAVVCVLVLVRLFSEDRVAAPPPAPIATAAAHASAPDPRVPQVRKLAPADRKQLGAQIAAALQRARAQRAAEASHAAAGGTAPSSDEDPVIPLEQVGKPLQEALTAAIPLLATCYEHAGSANPRTAAAMMTMVSDPDLGTVIDTAEITNPDGKHLDRELDDCLRDTIESLALPPLGQPGKLQLQYSFKFD